MSFEVRGRCETPSYFFCFIREHKEFREFKDRAYKVL